MLVTRFHRLLFELLRQKSKVNKIAFVPIFRARGPNIFFSARQIIFFPVSWTSASFKNGPFHWFLETAFWKFPKIQKLFLGGNITNGRLCMDILRTDVWSSAYSIENVLMEIAVTIADNGTRAKKNVRKNCRQKIFRRRTKKRTIQTIFERDTNAFFCAIFEVFCAIFKF